MQLVWSSFGRSCKKAGTTERLLGILTPHEDLGCLFGETMREQRRRSIGTPLAESRELRNLIGQWNAVEDLGKGLASPIAIETHDHNIATLDIHQIANKLDQSGKELSLFNDHKLVRNIYGKLLKHSARIPHYTRNLELIMGHNAGIFRLPLVNIGLNDKHGKIQRTVTTYHMVDLR